MIHATRNPRYRCALGVHMESCQRRTHRAGQVGRARVQRLAGGPADDLHRHHHEMGATDREFGGGAACLDTALPSQTSCRRPAALLPTVKTEPWPETLTRSRSFPLRSCRPTNLTYSTCEPPTKPACPTTLPALAGNKTSGRARTSRIASGRYCIVAQVAACAPKSTLPATKLG